MVGISSLRCSHGGLFPLRMALRWVIPSQDGPKVGILLLRCSMVGILLLRCSHGGYTPPVMHMGVSVSLRVYNGGLVSLSVCTTVGVFPSVPVVDPKEKPLHYGPGMRHREQCCTRETVLHIGRL